MKKLYTTTLAIILLTAVSFGQDSNSVSHISDNLGFTQSSRAIYKGTLLTHFGIGYNENNIHVTNFEFSSLTVTGPSLSIGYGVFKNVDFHISSAVQYHQYEYSNTYSGDTNTFGGESYRIRDFKLGTKINLFQQKKWIPELAYSLNLYTFLATDNNYSTLNNSFALSYQWGKRFRLGGNLAFIIDLDAIDINIIPEFSYSINARYEFMKGFGAFVDFQPIEIKNSELKSQLGLYYRLNNNMQFNLTGGKLLELDQSNISNIFFVKGGFSWLLLRDQ